jgi:ABC-type uncharacterized transport system auxiliary subunit
MNICVKMAGACLVLLLVGCIGPARNPVHKIDYYTLEYAAPVADSRATLPVILGVQRFQTAPEYRGNQIVYRDRHYNRNAYAYHKWRAHPGELVSFFLARDLQSSGRFRAVFSPEQNQTATHLIEGAVEEFFEYDDDQAWRAMLSVSITLLKENEPNITRRVVFQKQYRLSKPCQRKNPQALAAAMSQAMAELSPMILNDVYRFLAGQS